MKQPELFKKTVGILSKAYLQGELQAGQCGMCAVGNLCNGDREWSNIFTTVPVYDNEHNYLGCKQEFYVDLSVSDKDEVAFNGDEIWKDTGYSLNTLAKIEKIFETTFVESEHNYHNESPMGPHYEEEEDKAHFEALMAVVDFLCEFHEVEDPEPYKAQFVKV